MKRLLFFCGIIGIVLLTGFYVYKIMKQPVCKDCNVILISLDTLSANHLPCYGYERNTAPNLCRFGEENVMFTNMYANAGFTLPSHVSLFTGLLPSQHAVNFAIKDRLSSKTPFLPEILQKNGYKTYFSMPLHNIHLPVATVYNRGIDKLVDGDNPLAWKTSLRALSDNNKKGQKTFLFLHTYWVHDPYILENEKKTIYANNNDASTYPKTYEEYRACDIDFLTFLKKELGNDLTGESRIDKEEYPTYKEIHRQLLTVSDDKSMARFCALYKDSRYLEDYYHVYSYSIVDTKDAKMMDHLKDLYDSKIVELDKQLKDVFTYVQNSGLKKNTIIIVTADHGEEFMEHGRWGHGYNLYDTTVKVPLIMYVPGQGSKKITQIAQSVDIVPTLLSMLEIKKPYTFAGSNLFAKSISSKTKYEVAQELNQNINVDTVRDNEWKLFYQIKDGAPVGVHLFNYKKDPQEKNDVIFINPTVVERLLKNIPK